MPLRDRHHSAAVGIHVIEALRHLDFVTPGLTRLPAVLLQVVGGRGNQVADIINNVALAVAVEIDGIPLERGRHELRRSERAGP